MEIKNIFKKENNLFKELNMLPRETKNRILKNVNDRKAEIIESKLLSQQLKQFETNTNKENSRSWGKFKSGMQNRREELKRKGILKPVIRYNKENFQSALEIASKIARQREIYRLENQRSKLKLGYIEKPKIKLKKLKLKAGKKISL